MPYSHGTELRQRISENLLAFERERQSTAIEGLKPAAVVLAVAGQDDGTGALLITRRSYNLRTHKGQWALPGGRLDDGEDVATAALRELQEEINLTPPAQNILGLLDDYPTRSGYLMTPIVVWIDDLRQMAANPDEVASIHQIPLKELSRPDSPQFIRKGPDKDIIIRMLFNDARIHAPTAAVLYQFREVAVEGNAIRVSQYAPPGWAQR
jgi:8-oxo-dGTP pyrophosphatase MutT (NUDIX family)